MTTRETPKTLTTEPSSEHTMKINKHLSFGGWMATLTAAWLLSTLWQAAEAATVGQHAVDGLSGTQFNFTAKPGYLSTADGNSVYFWGYADGNGPAQYPGPTLLLSQGQVVNITLSNELPVPTSLLFPGQTGRATTTGATALGALTAEVLPGGSPVTYSFTADQPGTYLFYSGTQPDLQIEMGLVGAIVVYPTNSAGVTLKTQAYAHPASAFDQEYLFFLSDMDESIHIAVEQQVAAGDPISVDMTKRSAVYWFINGRTGPDTMLGAGAEAPWLPAQPYDCMPIFYAGQEILMRVVGGGRDPHPFHHHGNHARTIARDGRMLSSTATSGPDLQQLHFTVPSNPGGTVDALFSWTGAGLGWDIYGHAATDPLKPFEDPASHGLPFPVNLPNDQNLTFGQMYSGSPFIGDPEALPPGTGGFNAAGGYMYMWHSHNEKEIVNNNVFPGGLMTMALILPRP